MAARKQKPASQRKPKSAAIIELRRQARKDGWAKYIRQGEGEEADERAMLAGCKFDLRRANHVVKLGVFADGLRVIS